MARRKLYGNPEYAYLNATIKLTTPIAARKSVDRLFVMFEGAQRSKQMRIAQAAQSAGGRAMSYTRRRNMTPLERREMSEVSRVYRVASQKMYSAVHTADVLAATLPKGVEDEAARGD